MTINLRQMFAWRAYVSKAEFVLFCFPIFILGEMVAAVGQQPDLVLQTGHIFQVFSVAYSPDGKLIASGSEDNTVILWDAETGRQLRSLSIGKYSRGVYSVAFSPDGKTIASGNYGVSMMAWDVASGAERYIEGSSQSVLFLPDGKVLISAGNFGPIFWDTFTGKEIKGYGTSTSNEFPQPKINSVATSGDGKTIVTGGTEGLIGIWDTATGELKRQINNGSEVSSVAISPDGRLVASDADGSVYLWDVNTGAKVWTVDGALRENAFSPDGRSLVIWNRTEKRIRLHDVVTGKAVRTFEGEEPLVLTMAFSPDGKHLISGHGSGKVKQWDVDTGQPIMTLAGQTDSPHRFAISPNGDHIAIGRWNDNTIKLLDVAAGTLMTLKGHTDSIDPLVFSPDGKMLASGSLDDTLKLWDVGTGTLIRSIKEFNDIKSVSFSNDGRSLAIFCEDWIEKTRKSIRYIKRIDTSSGVELNKWEVWGRVISLAYSPDGKWITAASSNDIVTYDAASGNKALAIQNDSDLDRVAYSPDGRIIATHDERGLFNLWDATTGTQVSSFKEDDPVAKKAVFATAPDIYRNSLTEPVDQNGNMQIIRGRGEGRVEVNAFQTRENLATIVTINDDDWLVTTPGGFFDGTPNAWKQLIWRFNNNTFDHAPVETYFNDFFYPNLLQDVLAGNSPRPKAGQELSKIDRRQPRVEITRINGLTKDAIGEAPERRSSTFYRRSLVEIDVADNADPRRDPSNPATSGAQDLRLFRNGSLVSVWHGDLFRSDSGCKPVATSPDVARRVRCPAFVSLPPGDNSFTAYAFNSSNIKSTDVPFTIKGRESTERSGTFYILAIGVDKYADASLNLNFAVADAAEMAQTIARQQQKLVDEKLSRYARTQVITLKNEFATKENILSALDRFRNVDERPVPEGTAPELKAELEKVRRAEPEDAILVYFAGHGAAAGDRFYLLPHNFTQRTDAGLARDGISDLELSTMLENIDAGKMSMAIDACQSGQALGAANEGKAPMNSKGLAQLAYDKGMFILTAAQSQQAALEVSRLGHGLLTYALLQGLEKADKNADGEITERKWLDYAVRTVPELQLEEMRGRDVQIKKDPGKRGAELVFVNGGNKNLPPEKRGLQTPRVFYRGGLEASPLVIAKP